MKSLTDHNLDNKLKKNSRKISRLLKKISNVNKDLKVLDEYKDPFIDTNNKISHFLTIKPRPFQYPIDEAIQILQERKSRSIEYDQKLSGLLNNIGNSISEYAQILSYYLKIIFRTSKDHGFEYDNPTHELDELLHTIKLDFWTIHDKDLLKINFLENDVKTESIFSIFQQINEILSQINQYNFTKHLNKIFQRYDKLVSILKSLSVTWFYYLGKFLEVNKNNEQLISQHEHSLQTLLLSNPPRKSSISTALNITKQTTNSLIDSRKKRKHKSKKFTDQIEKINYYVYTYEKTGGFDDTIRSWEGFKYGLNQVGDYGKFLIMLGAPLAFAFITYEDFKERWKNRYTLDKIAVPLHKYTSRDLFLMQIIYPKCPNVNHPMPYSKYVKRKYHHNNKSKGLFVIYPPWHGKLSFQTIMREKLKRSGFSVLEYEFNPNILSAHWDLTLHYFLEIQKNTSMDIQSVLQKQNNKQLNIISQSLGNVNASTVLNYLTDNKIAHVDNILMIVPGHSLADGLWTGIRTTDIKEDFERFGITFEVLNNRWKQLNPINIVSGFNGTNVHILYSPYDLVIRPNGILNFYNALKQAGAHPHLHKTDSGHFLGLINFLLKPGKLLFEMTNNPSPEIESKKIA